MRYEFCTDKKNKFRILQFTDIQYDKDVDDESIRVVDAVTEYASPDLIILTGDNVGGEFLIFRKKKALSIVEQITRCFDRKKIPWTMCFGNHDAVWGKRAKRLMSNVYEQGEYFLGAKNEVKGLERYENEQEDTYRNSFYPVFDSNGREVFGIVVLDCATAVFTPYKAFCDSQLEFYGNISVRHKDLPIVLFTHIPIKEMQTAYDKREDKQIVKAFVGDAENPLKGKVYYPSKDEVQNQKFSEKMLRYGNIKGVFVGHDHLANFAAVSNMREGYDMITAYGRLSSYGMKAWQYVPFSPKDRKRYDAYKRGGRIVDLYSDGNITTTDLTFDKESGQVRENAVLSLYVKNDEK